MNAYFVEALDIREHPIKKAKKKTQAEYVTALTYIVERSIGESSSCPAQTIQYVTARLHLYQDRLFPDGCIEAVDEKKGKQCLRAFSKLWKKMYRFMFVCDIVLILLDEALVSVAMKMVKEWLSAKWQAEVEQVIALLQNDQDIDKKYRPAASLIRQYRANKKFMATPERRIIVTANMSAGKSTLINALIGKAIARTSQEVCTGNVCYLYNKAYEDEHIHLLTEELHLCATPEDLRGYDWNGTISIASYFAGIEPDVPRLCIMDTPGVDAALHKEHSRMTRDALLRDNYDTILYVVSPTRLGTDAEKKHLHWVAQNLQKYKIIFVLNKLDNYHDFSDSIADSLYAFQKELVEIGFADPVICPISAYFAYLLKLKMTGQTLSEDEMDEYAYYSQKFKRPAYDLSQYYDGIECLPTDSEEIALSKHVGLYGFEKILYGGRS